MSFIKKPADKKAKLQFYREQTHKTKLRTKQITKFLTALHLATSRFPV